jgi:hypothetical protein
MDTLDSGADSAATAISASAALQRSDPAPGASRSEQLSLTQKSSS